MSGMFHMEAAQWSDARRHRPALAAHLAQPSDRLRTGDTQMVRARPTIRRRRVAREVRRLREEAGRTREEVAALLECQTPKISKLEGHKANFNPSELVRVLDFLGAEEPLRSQLIAWNREARVRGL